MILRAALGALFVSLLAIGGARAADLGGNCCADLEERIAELEATAATKGNRKMSVVIYGQVDKAWLYESNNLTFGKPATGTKDQTGVIDNANSPTMFGITGESKLGKDTRAGFRVEIQLDGSFANSSTRDIDHQTTPTIRTAVGWFDTAVGKFTIGHGSMASDKTGQVTTANTEVASRMLSLAPVSTVFLFGVDLPYNDVRRDSLRYDSPSLFGLMLSASVANGDGTPSVPAMFATTHDAWDIAARYANEFKGAGGWRLAGAISYRDEQQALIVGPALGHRSSVVTGSGSVMNLATGLFVNVAGGHIENDSMFGNADNYQIQGGIEKNFFGFGASTAFVEYAWMDFNIPSKTGPVAVQPKMWGLGAVQSFDALAIDVYADYKHYDTDKVFVPSITGDVFMAGMRVKF